MKFSPAHIKLINEAQELIKKLQKQQEMAYDVLLLNLPDMFLESNTKEMIWDFCFNNKTHSMILDENGFKFELIFGGE